MPYNKYSGAEVLVGGVVIRGLRKKVRHAKLRGSDFTSTTSLTALSSMAVEYGAIIEDVYLVTRTAASSATNTLDVVMQGSSTVNMLKAVQPTSVWVPVLNSYRDGGSGALWIETTNYGSKVPFPTRQTTSRTPGIVRSSTAFSTTWVGDLYIKYSIPDS